MLARQRQRNFKVGVIPVKARDEIFPGNLEQSLLDALGLEVSMPDEPPDFGGPLLFKFLSAFRWPFRGRYDPASHFCPTRQRNEALSSPEVSHWNQVQGLLVRWQREYLFHPVILKGADGRRTQLECDRLKQDVLRRVTPFQVNVAGSTVRTVLDRCARIHRRDHGWRFEHRVLPQRRSMQCWSCVA